MNLLALRTANLVQLAEMVDKAKNQEELNMITYEITCRMYVPFSGIEFDELLIKNGYRLTKKPKNKKMKIKLTK